MRLVEHEQRAVARAHLGELVDRRDVAVHREHRLGDDDARARRVDAREELVDVRGVAVAVDRERRAREPAAVDDRRVVELVGAHEHVGPARTW